MFRHKLRDLRRENKLTQETLAKLLKVGKTTICFLETGAREPSLDMLVKVAKLFNVTTDWLLEDDYIAVKERPQGNTVTFIENNGVYTIIELQEEDIQELRECAQKMSSTRNLKII